LSGQDASLLLIVRFYSKGWKKMHNNEPGTPVDSTLGYTFQNDFLALTQAFSLPEIDYTDISQREQLAAAIKRWPLLAEFAHQQ
jgi:hypothetical protein